MDNSLEFRLRKALFSQINVEKLVEEEGLFSKEFEFKITPSMLLEFGVYYQILSEINEFQEVSLSRSVLLKNQRLDIKRNGLTSALINSHDNYSSIRSVREVDGVFYDENTGIINLLEVKGGFYNEYFKPKRTRNRYRKVYGKFSHQTAPEQLLNDEDLFLEKPNLIFVYPVSKGLSQDAEDFSLLYSGRFLPIPFYYDSKELDLICCKLNGEPEKKKKRKKIVFYFE